MARRANALSTLLTQVNELYPNRSKASDGWIGDAAHASRPSDHNPLPNGVVTAQDFTHSPGHLDGNWLAERLIQSGDKRIKYIIWNRRIWQGGWKAYTGSNPHDKHLHLSVSGQQALYDNATKWNLGGNEMLLSDKDVIAIYGLAFDNEDVSVNPDVVRAFTGKTHRELVNYLRNDPSWLAHKKRVNTPPAISKYKPVLETLYREEK